MTRMPDIAPTDADFEVALGERFMDGKAAWSVIKGAAIKVAAKRLLDVNSAERKRLNEGLAGLSHERFIAELERFDRLEAESQELQRIAYPAAFSEVSRG